MGLKTLNNINRRLKQLTCFRLRLQCLFLISSILFLMIIPACEDPYWPELGEKYDNLLVVEGRISNQPGPYTVKLSHSTTLLYPKYFPLEGFEVVIEDDEGNSETLSETESGVYQTAPNGIRGITGRSYRLLLNGPDNQSYISDFEILREPMPIDTIYTDIEYTNSDYHTFDIPGYRFFINTQTGNEDTTYIRWQLEETYEYTSDFKIYFYYDGVLHDFSDPDSLHTCWLTEPVYEIFTASTAGLNNPIIADYPLHYVSFEQREISIRYSLLIKQLTLSENAYTYWKDVADQNTSGGEFYTSLPYQIKGNVHNVNDGDEIVLGYFEVAGEDRLRVFINRPAPPQQMYYPICELTEGDYKEYGEMFRIKDWREWPRYVVVDLYGNRAVPQKFCSDCREKGGKIEKPDFWID